MMENDGDVRSYVCLGMAMRDVLVSIAKQSNYNVES